MTGGRRECGVPAVCGKGGEEIPAFFIMEKLSQDDIDALIHNISSSETDAPGSPPKNTLKSKKCNEKYYAVNAAKKRYDFALTWLPFDRVAIARRYLHNAAFELWLANRSMTRKEFRRLLQKEIEKRT